METGTFPFLMEVTSDDVSFHARHGQNWNSLCAGVRVSQRMSALTRRCLINSMRGEDVLQRTGATEGPRQPPTSQPTRMARSSSVNVPQIRDSDQDNTSSESCINTIHLAAHTQAHIHFPIQWVGRLSGSSLPPPTVQHRNRIRIA